MDSTRSLQNGCHRDLTQQVLLPHEIVDSFIREGELHRMIGNVFWKQQCIFFVIKLQVGNKKHLATKDLEYFWQMEQNLGTRWFKNHPILSETQLHVVALAVIWYQTCTAKNMGITMSNPSHICQASTTDLRGCIPYRLYGDGAEALRVLAFKSGLFRICSCFMLNNCFLKLTCLRKTEI